jgi:hypothetical protein
MRAVDEHLKLARVAVSFKPNLDEAFKVNVAKMRVLLPASLKSLVEELIAPTIRLARETYDRKVPAATAAGSSGDAGGRISKTLPTASIEQAAAGKSPPPASRAAGEPDRLSLAEWSQLLLSKTRPKETPIVRKVLGRLSESQEHPNDA